MKIADPAQDTLVNEIRLMLDELPFDGARVLELGAAYERARTALLAQPRFKRWEPAQ